MLYSSMLTITPLITTQYKYNSASKPIQDMDTVKKQSRSNFGSHKSVQEILGRVNTKINKEYTISKITKKELEILDECIEYFERDVYKKLEPGRIFGEKNVEKIYLNLIKNWNNIKIFVALLSKQKPSIILADERKILESGKYNGFDAVSEYIRYQNGGSIFNTFILNPELCKPIINKYKSLFTSKINLPETYNTDDIYNSLLTTNSPLFRDDKKFADIRGLLLGFPPKSSILFNLENMLPVTERRSFNDIEKHRTLLREALNSEPYSGISKEMRKLAEDAISELTGKDYNTYTLSEAKHGKILGFDYIRFIPEPKDEERLIKAYRNTIEKLKELTAEERIEALLFS